MQLLQRIGVRANYRLFSPLFLLTTLFFLFELSIMQKNIWLHISGTPLMFGVMHAYFASTHLVLGLLWLSLVQITLHALWLGLIYFITQQISQLAQLSKKTRRQVGILLWLLSAGTLLVANEYFYPSSQFAFILRPLNKTTADIAIYYAVIGSLICLSTIMIIAFAVAIVQFIKNFAKQFRVTFWIAAITSITVGAWLSYSPNPAHATHTTSKNKPNIILIGLDSIRTDYVNKKGLMPHVNAFLESSLQFKHAFTPLARTFPAWVSILSGQHPLHTQVRFNLLNPSKTVLQNSLAIKMREHGYQTIFATDERRFSNIDTQYGFDEIIGPATNANDFLLGSINDLPLSNLLVNTKMGKWLFPYSHMNRAVASLYKPETFTRNFSDSLSETSNQPLFLAMHLCLSHWPYRWGNNLSPGENQKFSLVKRYTNSLKRLDKQFNALFNALKAKHLLEHSIVIVFSDHGESLGQLDERITQAKNYSGIAPYPSNQFRGFFGGISLGHGTDVLSIPQYNIVFGVHNYGYKNFKAGVNESLISLLDIKPTLLDVLGETTKQNDGLSLMPIMQGKSITDQSRYFFIESALTVNSLKSQNPSVMDILTEGIQYYNINPLTGRLFVKNESLAKIIETKQRAVIQWPWLLAMYPYKDKAPDLVLANLVTGQWADQWDSQLAKLAPVDKLADALFGFYGEDINSVKE